MKVVEQNRRIYYTSPAAIMGKKVNQFRILRGLSYFSNKKEGGSINMKIYINIFPLCFTALRIVNLKLLRCVAEGGRQL
jgi:hypothetical protein